jgi:hypothetical protein
MQSKDRELAELILRVFDTTDNIVIKGAAHEALMEFAEQSPTEASFTAAGLDEDDFRLDAIERIREDIQRLN